MRNQRLGSAHCRRSARTRSPWLARICAEMASGKDRQPAAVAAPLLSQPICAFANRTVPWSGGLRTVTPSRLAALATKAEQCVWGRSSRQAPTDTPVSQLTLSPASHRRSTPVPSRNATRRGERQALQQPPQLQSPLPSACEGSAARHRREQRERRQRRPSRPSKAC